VTERAIRLGAVLAVVLTAAGCGPSVAKVKGRLVENGQPTSFPPMTASVQLTAVGPNGQPDNTKVYACVVEPDGTFELVAAGGEIPPGKYLVAVEVTGKSDKYAAFATGATKVRREIKGGQNELVIDLAKPEG